MINPKNKNHHNKETKKQNLGRLCLFDISMQSAKLTVNDKKRKPISK